MKESIVKAYYTYFFSSELHSKTIHNVMIAVKLGVGATLDFEEALKKLILLLCQVSSVLLHRVVSSIGASATRNPNSQSLESFPTNRKSQRIPWCLLAYSQWQWELGMGMRIGWGFTKTMGMNGHEDWVRVLWDLRLLVTKFGIFCPDPRTWEKVIPGSKAHWMILPRAYELKFSQKQNPSL